MLLMLTLVLVISPLFVFASHGEEIIPTQPASYLFHLYYDNDQLFADRDFEFKYDVIPEEYAVELYRTEFHFKGEIFNLKNESVFQFNFDPKRGDPGFIKGKIQIKAPYIPDGQKVVFYNNQGNSLVTIFVQDSSFCNDDSVCDFDKGEDDKTCPNDCSVPPTTNNQQPITEEGGTSSKMITVMILAVVLAGVGVWYFWRKMKKPKFVQEDQFTNKLQ